MKPTKKTASEKPLIILTAGGTGGHVFPAESLGVVQAAYILFTRKPACVIGFGGYASFPCSMAAILLGIDLIIHEQNSVMSRTNRFLSKYAALIAQSFRNAAYQNHSDRHADSNRNCRFEQTNLSRN